MRLHRRNVVLALALVALVAYDVATLPDRGPDRRVGPLFPDLDPGRVARIEVVEGDGEPLVIVRAEPGATGAPGATGPGVDPAGVDVPGGPEDPGWVLPAAFGYPANPFQVETLLVTPLCSVSTLDLVAEDAARHATYGVDGGGTVVRLLDARGEPLAELVEGGRAPDGEAIYVRALDDVRVYRMPRGRRAPSSLAAYLDAELLPFEPSRVTHVRLSGPALEGRALRFRRDLARPVPVWFDASGERERQVAPRDLDALVTDLDRLPVGRVLAGERPEGEPLLTVEVELQGGATHALELFPGDGGGASTDLAPAVRVGAPFTLGVPQGLHRILLDRARSLRGL